MAAEDRDSDPVAGDDDADEAATEPPPPPPPVPGSSSSSSLDHEDEPELAAAETVSEAGAPEEAAAAATKQADAEEEPTSSDVVLPQLPLPFENNDNIRGLQDEADDSSFTLAIAEMSGNVVSSQSAAAIEMLENINSVNSTSPAVTGETRDLMPDLVTKSGPDVQSRSTADVDPSSPIERDRVETELHVGIPSSPAGPSEPSTGAPVLESDGQEASDSGLEEERLLYDLSESSNCCDHGLPEELRSSTEGAADVRSSVLPVSEATKDVGSSCEEETVASLKLQVKELEIQLHEQMEWAQQKVMQAARRLSKDLAELKALRQAREEMLRLKNDQKALEDSTMKKLSEMESALKKASGQVDRANAAVRRLENENAEVQAEMEAAKLNAAESIAICQEIAKRDKKSLKQAQAWERQKVKLQENLSEERRKLTQLQQQLTQAKEQQQQAEVRWRQEEKVKEEAVLRADSEKRLREQAEAATKRREESIRRKADADKQRHRDDIQRLEQAITTLRVSAESSHPATWRWGPALVTTPSRLALKEINERRLLPEEVTECQDFSTRDVGRDRECVMCMCEEMSVVFLPCAHQVVCAKCNELHEKQGMQDCPSCRTPIQQRIRVYGVSS